MSIQNTTPNQGYELPAPPNRLSEDVQRLIAAISKIDADVAQALLTIAAKAPLNHTHTIAEITGLTAALLGYAPVGHNHTLASLSGVSISAPVDGQVMVFSGGQWVNAPISMASIDGLTAALASLQAQIDDLDGGTF